MGPKEERGGKKRTDEEPSLENKKSHERKKEKNGL